jgi:hypothetical protein
MTPNSLSGRRKGTLDKLIDTLQEGVGNPFARADEINRLRAEIDTSGFSEAVRSVVVVAGEQLRRALADGDPRGLAEARRELEWARALEGARVAVPEGACSSSRCVSYAGHLPTFSVERDDGGRRDFAGLTAVRNASRVERDAGTTRLTINAAVSSQSPDAFG